MARLANWIAPAVALAMLCGAAQAATLNANPSNIKAILLSAKGGDTIVMAPGEYPDQGLLRRTFEPALVIDSHAAVMVGWQFATVSGVTFRGGIFRVPPPMDSRKEPGTLAYGTAFQLYTASHIHISDATFQGPGNLQVDPPVLGQGWGIRVNGGEDVWVTDSRFEGLRGGAAFGQIEGFKIVNNVSAGSRSDGFDVALSHRGLIEGNTCLGTQMSGEGEHPDCIQLWSRPTAPPVSDIVIRKNKIYGATQGIGMFNHTRNGVNDGGFDRIVIEDNDIEVSFPHGIGINGERDSIVRNNHVRTMKGAKYLTRISTEEATLRCGNTVADGGGKSGWTEKRCPPNSPPTPQQP